MNVETNSPEQGGPKPKRTPEQAREYMRNWRALNREKYREYGRDYAARKTVHNPRQVMLERARSRAAALGREFTLTVDDIVIPSHCPILGLPLVQNKGKLGGDSASLDRLDSTRGYVPGNVWVISHLANSMKSAATPEQLLAFGRWTLTLESSNAKI